MDSFIVKMMNGDRAKINANNDESYKAAVKLLEEKKCRWHSYENKQDRPIRVMAKNLHSSCIPERIVDDLKNKGFKIQTATNKLRWKTKEPLNMFMLSFDKDEEVNKIYNIKSILGCKVDIKSLTTPKLIPQCKRCQSYGHTQKYCSKEPRCVKCTGKHLTSDCKKPAEQKPKCIHCGESHPASYRGCTVAKELQKIKEKSHKKMAAKPSATVPNKNKFSTGLPVSKHVSFAQVAKGTQPSQTKPTNSNSDDKLDRILNMLNTFDERLKKLEGSNKTTATAKNY